MFRSPFAASAVSRRSFLRLAGMASVAVPILTEAHFAREGGGHGEVRKAVITVPAYFDDAQRQATRDAQPNPAS